MPETIYNIEDTQERRRQEEQERKREIINNLRELALETMG